MSNKTIIISLIAFLALSCVFLSYTQTKQQSPQSQNWWVVYFADPKNDKLDFVIENNSDETNFHYEATAGKSAFEQKDIEVKKGEKKNIEIISPDIESFGNVKFDIIISARGEKKEIYKNLGN
jgi:hypothetical protein